MDSFPAYIAVVGWTVWPRGSIPRKQCARFQSIRWISQPCGTNSLAEHTLTWNSLRLVLMWNIHDRAPNHDRGASTSFGGGADGGTIQPQARFKLHQHMGMQSTDKTCRDDCMLEHLT
ncbi:hypothetical protein OPV22_030498 [Ensete ventricosum]|uniref:Uncharacterized protein n=1 Tax=Ensete ventricosum TaxID=4639 RepID=A0AAV8QE91_ENSVE|nr:hypothetical protein OPV22_030498 [Ensete ventricosum]